MKQYKLLKDLPELKAGSTFVEVGKGDMENLKLIYQIDDDGVPRCAYTWIDPEKPNEWFEEIQESTDSIHWKPEQNEKIWYLDENGDTNFTYFDKDNPYHLRRVEFGNAYRTSEECEKARSRKFAKARLRRTSTFEPDFENRNGGWIVVYNYAYHKLFAENIRFEDAGEPVRYATEEDAEKSIKENREDWLTYFGIEEEE